MRWQRMALGVASVGASVGMMSACVVMTDPAGRPDPDHAPVATDDSITTTADTPVLADLLANDKDPDSNALAVTTFTQGAHGLVEMSDGVAKYIPAAGFTGSDSFHYTISDGHGMTDTALVTVMVTPVSPNCTIIITGPATGTFGETIHLTSTAACTTGAAQVQWYHRVNSGYVVVQPYSATQTLDLPADVVGNNLFYALVRTQGTSSSQGMSNTVTVKAVDNTPQCTLVKMVGPTNNQSVAVGATQALTALATCPAGSVPEYQFWVKPVGAANWQILPGYTTTSGSWAPPTAGDWAVRAVARTTGSHVNYQMASMSVTVHVTP